MNVVDLLVNPFRRKKVAQPSTDCAQNLTESTQTIILSLDDQRAIVAALKTPRDPSSTLSRAFKRHLPTV